MNMTEEEKEAIEILEAFEPDDLIECSIYRKALEIIKNLIQKQGTEINKLNNVIDRMAEYIFSKTDFTTCGNIKSIKEYFMKEDK